MFGTLELQYLNKLSEGKVGDFASPKPFHAFKIQRLDGDGIKPSAKVCGKFPMPIFALVSDMPIQPHELTDSTPPIVRASNLSAKCFVERSEFVQGVLQRLGVLIFLTRVERQIGVHTEIYPYALTCSRIGFSCGVVCDDIQPIGANRIAKDLDIANNAFPITVMVERKPTFVELQGLRGFIPRLERKSDTSILKFVARLELRRTIAIFAFELRQPAKSIKKALIGGVKADNHSVKGIARYPRPMSLRVLEQLRQMRLQPIPTRIFTIDTVIPFLKFQKVIMDITQVVEHVAKTHILWMFAYLIFIRSAFVFFLSLFHGFSRITLLTPFKWVGRHITLRLCLNCLPT